MRPGRLKNKVSGDEGEDRMRYLETGGSVLIAVVMCWINVPASKPNQRVGNICDIIGKA